MVKSDAWRAGAYAALDGKKSKDNPHRPGHYFSSGVSTPQTDWEAGRGWAMGQLDRLRDEIRGM